MSKVSVIIPAYNAAASVGESITAVLENREVLEVIVVDDMSSDDTASVVCRYAERDSRVRLLRNPENLGAGGSRNVGMAAARGAYLYFLDADDVLAHRSIDEVMYHMEANGCDVMVFCYRYITQEDDHLDIMLPIDQKAWKQLMGNNVVRVFSLSECGRLLFTVNFPWNKIVSAKLCRDTGLRFSDTRVHNDIYAHWHIYLHAKKIGMLNRYLIGHRVYDKNKQLTNVFTEKRLEIFKAFSEVEALFNRAPQIKQAFYHWFLHSKHDLLDWIYPRLPVNLRERFLILVEQSYEGFGQHEYNYVRFQSPEMAEISLKLKRTPYEVLKNAKL